MASRRPASVDHDPAGIEAIAWGGLVGVDRFGPQDPPSATVAQFQLHVVGFVRKALDVTFRDADERSPCETLVGKGRNPRFGGVPWGSGHL